VTLIPGERVAPTDLEDALTRLGVQARTERRTDGRRATEVWPATDRSLLGRCLAAMGVPVGQEKQAAESLPDFLEDAHPRIRFRFAGIYARHRAQLRDKPTVQLQEDRPDAYRRDLAALFADVTGADATAGQYAVTLSADAARALSLS